MLATQPQSGGSGSGGERASSGGYARSRPTAQHHVVIVGGGFGGLQTAKNLRKAPVRVTLLDRRNFHLFQPLLYQVATGTLSPANIAAPLRRILRGSKNTRVLLAEVTDIDPVERTIRFQGGTLAYDTLVLAAGAEGHYFGHNEWQRHAPGLKTVEDATEMRARILNAFEQAEKASDPVEREAWLTFVIVGGGPTGVELAGALAEISRRTLRHDFRTIRPEEASIILVEAATNVLDAFPTDLAESATQQVRDLGVTVLGQSRVVDVQADHVLVCTDGTTRKIPTHAVLWAAGIKPSPLAQTLAAKLSVPLTRGRVPIDEHLNVLGHENIFVIGDMAYKTASDGQPLPGIAPVAMQQGEYVASTIIRRERGEPTPPFVYRDRGMMAVIGRSRAVAAVFGRHVSGTLAWYLWLFVHIIFLIQFENRLLVMLQWAWSYLTYNKSARIITMGLVREQPPILENVEARRPPSSMVDVPPSPKPVDGLKSTETAAPTAKAATVSSS